MDAVVLAAGRNDRLKGIVPAYMKPLILVNGVPLIKTLVQGLAAVAGRVIVVCAPQNALQITDVLSECGTTGGLFFVIQPAADGPAGALNIGAQLVKRKSVMVVCADNVIPTVDLMNAAREHRADPDKTTVMTRLVPRESAERFTRVYREEQFIYEGPVYPVGQEYDLLTGRADVQCWVGPLVFNTEDLLGALATTRSDKISALIDPTRMKTVPGNTTDIGVPDSLPRHVDL